MIDRKTGLKIIAGIQLFALTETALAQALPSGTLTYGPVHASVPVFDGPAMVLLAISMLLIAYFVLPRRKAASNLLAVVLVLGSLGFGITGIQTVNALPPHQAMDQPTGGSLPVVENILNTYQVQTTNQIQILTVDPPVNCFYYPAPIPGTYPDCLVGDVLRNGDVCQIDCD